MPHSSESQLSPSERFEATLNLRSQYETLVKTLNESGVLQLLPEHGDVGIVGLDPESRDKAREYPLPSFEVVALTLREQAESIETKTSQGFTKLLLVPMAQPLDKLKATYGELLKTHHREGKLLDSEGKPIIDLDTETPVWAWDAYTNADIEGKLVYYPKSFDQNHGGQTKQELIAATLASPFPGWEVKLVEDIPNLPAQGQGTTIGGRRQIEANHTPKEYLKQPQEDLQYKEEIGFTPEDWLTEAIAHLKATNQVLDDYQGKGKISYNTGGYFPASVSVAIAGWGRYGRRARLGRGSPVVRNGDYSARRSVRVGRVGREI